MERPASADPDGPASPAAPNTERSRGAFSTGTKGCISQPALTSTLAGRGRFASSGSGRRRSRKEKRPPDASRMTVKQHSLPLSSASLRTSTEASRSFLVVDTEPWRPRSRTLLGLPALNKTVARLASGHPSAVRQVPTVGTPASALLPHWDLMAVDLALNLPPDTSAPV